MIVYLNSADGIRSEQLLGFFVGWGNAPSPETHLRLLHSSSHVALALDDEPDRVVGFATAISDGVLSAAIPLLEVLPAYQRRGIGTELFRRILDTTSGLYMTDITCDPERVTFYDRFGLDRATAMIRRQYGAQPGLP